MPEMPETDIQLLKRQLYPFCEMRHPYDLRVGLLSIREKWRHLVQQEPDTDGNWTFQFDGRHYCVPPNLVPGTAWQEALLQGSPQPGYSGSGYRLLNHPWQLAQWNDWALRQDFVLLSAGRSSQPIPRQVQVDHPGLLFIEEGARIAYCSINTSTGPVYIGRDAEIMEGCLIRGPFGLGEGSVVKMGTRIYGASSTGPGCVLGGEIKNSLLLGYSNKAHDGYLGDSVLGEWCNLGAGTSNSNLKNAAGTIQVFNPRLQQYIAAGTKCGLLMGDYSRSAINTSFNTGTVCGISANVFGQGLSPRHIPDFSWGGFDDGRYQWEKALRDIANWKALKNKTLTENEIRLLKGIFDR